MHECDNSAGSGSCFVFHVCWARGRSRRYTFHSLLTCLKKTAFGSCNFCAPLRTQVRVPKSCGTARGWRITEAEAVLAGFPVIEPADFWIGVCKAVGLRQKTSRHKTQDRRKEEEWWTVGGAGDCGGFSRGEGKEAMAAVGLSPMKLRRVLRAELGRKQEATERPLHRSPALRKVFKQAAALASAEEGSLRPAHLLVALIESGDPVVSAAVTKLGHDSFAVLRELREKISRIKNQDSREEEEGCTGHRGGG